MRKAILLLPTVRMTHCLWPLLLMVGILSAVRENALSAPTAIWFGPQSGSSSPSVFQSWFKSFLSGEQPTVPSSFHIKHSSSLHKNSSSSKYVSFFTAHLAPFFYCKLVSLLASSAGKPRPMLKGRGLFLMWTWMCFNTASLSRTLTLPCT